MTEELEAALESLERHIQSGLDLIHDETLAKFDWLVRSVGQKLRTDRVKFK